MFLSSKLKNPMTVLVIDIAIIMLPVFLSIKSVFGIWNKILFLMPYNAIYSNFSQMVSYKIGNIVDYNYLYDYYGYYFNLCKEIL